LPKSLFRPLLQKAHSAPNIGAHIGPTLLEQTFREKYFYPKLKEQIQEYCDACILCQIGKSDLHKISISPGNIRASYPRQIVALDLALSFPETPKKEIGILLIVDLFSSYCVATPIKTKLSKEILNKFIYTYAMQCQNPLIIRSDSESGIIMGEFKEYCDMHDIKQVPCSSGSSWINSPAEKKIHVIKDQLRCIIAQSNNKADWTKILPQICCVNNNTVRSGHFTPYEIFFGCKNSKQTDMILKIDAKSDMSSYIDAKRRINDQITQLQQDHLSKHYDKIINKYNKNKVEKTFKQGELVWLKNIRIPSLTGNAINPRYLGPYRILQIIDTVTAIIMHSTNGAVYRRHFNFLKPCIINDNSIIIPDGWDHDFTQTETAGPRRSERIMSKL